jgi:hypothetical protein
MKLSADNFCALIIIIASVVAAINFMLQHIGLNGLSFLIVLGLLIYRLRKGKKG